MALSQVSYPATGATNEFTVSFPYLSRSHVTVTVDEVNESFTWLSDTLIRTSSSAASLAGKLVKIKRRTSQSVRLVDFPPVGTLQEEDLDTDGLQAYYMAQEAIDEAADIRSVVDSLSLGGIAPIAASIAAIPSGNLAGTNVQAQLSELEAEKVPINAAFTGQITGPASGIVYSFVGDTDTGIGRVAAGAVSLISDNAETVRVTANAARVFGSVFINQVGTSTSWSLFCDASVLYFRSDDAAANVASLSESGAFNAVGGINDNGRRAFSASSMYQSAQTTVTNSSWHVWAHGLAGRPVGYKVVLQCVTPEAGYAVGDELDVTCGGSNVDYYFTEVNATEIAWCLPRFLIASSRTTASSVINLTPANWRVVARAWY